MLIIISYQNKGFSDILFNKSRWHSWNKLIVLSVPQLIYLDECLSLSLHLYTSIKVWLDMSMHRKLLILHLSTKVHKNSLAIVSHGCINWLSLCKRIGEECKVSKNENKRVPFCLDTFFLHYVRYHLMPKDTHATLDAQFNIVSNFWSSYPSL